MDWGIWWSKRSIVGCLECCSMCVAACVLQHVCCSVLQYVAVCCSEADVLHGLWDMAVDALGSRLSWYCTLCVAVCCSVLRCVTVRWSAADFLDWLGGGQRCTGFRVFLCHFQRMSSIISGFSAEWGLQFKASYASLPPCSIVQIINIWYSLWKKDIHTSFVYDVSWVQRVGWCDISDMLKQVWHASN